MVTLRGATHVSRHRGDGWPGWVQRHHTLRIRRVLTALTKSRSASEVQMVRCVRGERYTGFGTHPEAGNSFRSRRPAPSQEAASRRSLRRCHTDSAPIAIAAYCRGMAAGVAALRHAVRALAGAVVTDLAERAALAIAADTLQPAAVGPALIRLGAALPRGAVRTNWRQIAAALPPVVAVEQYFSSGQHGPSSELMPVPRERCPGGQQRTSPVVVNHCRSGGQHSNGAASLPDGRPQRFGSGAARAGARSNVAAGRLLLAAAGAASVIAAELLGATADGAALLTLFFFSSFLAGHERRTRNLREQTTESATECPERAATRQCAPDTSAEIVEAQGVHWSLPPVP